MSNYNEATKINIFYDDDIIQAFSPTQLGKNNIAFTLYRAVLEDVQAGGKRKSKDKSKKVSKKPVVSQKKQSIYKEILGKQMKIYKMPDSRKEYVKYKDDLHLISDYKSLIMKQKAMAKPKAIAKPKPKK
jgi:hypothetical protein